MNPNEIIHVFRQDSQQLLALAQPYLHCLLISNILYGARRADWALHSVNTGLPPNAVKLYVWPVKKLTNCQRLLGNVHLISHL